MSGSIIEIVVGVLLGIAVIYFVPNNIVGQLLISFCVTICFGLLLDAYFSNLDGVFNWDNVLSWLFLSGVHYFIFIFLPCFSVILGTRLLRYRFPNGNG